MTQHTFLVEIGTEELPPKSLRILGEAFLKNFSSELNKAKIKYSHVKWFATPRRIALKVFSISYLQNNKTEKQTNIMNYDFSLNQSYNKITKDFSKKNNINISNSDFYTKNKHHPLIYYPLIKHKCIKNLLHSIVISSLKKISTINMMRWGHGDIEFVRPVHSITLMLDDKLIPGKVLGVSSGRIIRGHRFIGESEIYLTHADDYPKILLDRGMVIADYDERKSRIKKDTELAAFKIGGSADINDLFLEEVTSSVEWPSVAVASFEKKFLSLPEEVLVHIITNDQKSFPIYDKNNNLMPYFIVIANIESKDIQQIILGNERVVHPRLSDAEFFFNTDRKKRLEDYFQSLSTVLFQKDLGTLQDKSNRIQALSKWIAHSIGADVEKSSRAGLLSKCDLMTNMVFEFKETKGAIGMHYARLDNELEEIAIAQKEHYYPRFSEDILPTTLVSSSVAIADKIDTIVGIFGIGKYASGDKDPFALRRFALGIVRIIIDNNLPIDMNILLEKSANLYGNRLINPFVINDVIDFIIKRIRVWYKEKGYSLDIIDTMLTNCSNCLIECNARIIAASCFRAMDTDQSLTIANKRISNILSKSEDILADTVDISIMKEKAEIQLATHLISLQKKIPFMFESKNYKDALIELLSLREPISIFFKEVMVMVKNSDVRINRLTLLNQLHELFLKAVNLSLF